MKRIQIFNIDTENCSECIHGRFSDLYDEHMCNNPIESHILYPDHRGSEDCPFKEEGD